MHYLRQDYHQTLDFDMTYKLMPLLLQLIDEANKVSGEWNGDDTGTLSDRAELADEIAAKANELSELIANLQNEDY